MSDFPPPHLPPNDYLTESLVIADFLSRDECRQVMALRQDAGLPAEVQTPRGDYGQDAIRVATRYPILPGPATAWLNDRLKGLVMDANQRFYRFKLRYISQIELLEYGPGGKYDWHIDIGKGGISHRKLSVVVFINAPDEYEGGGLIMGPKPFPVANQQGSAVIFPSYLGHQVQPVTKGIRFTLVCWANGPAFQ